jgi:NAD-dependent deacetylase
VAGQEGPPTDAGADAIQKILTPADPAWQTAIADMAEFVAGARRLVALTGAGASTESGIPDFRSPGGIRARVAPTSYHAFLSSAEARRHYWRLRRELGPTVASAQPNAVHYALAELERRGILAAILTQNFDGLHQTAGSSPERVVELHGTSREAACQSCGARAPIESLQARVEDGEEDPRCASIPPHGCPSWRWSGACRS